MVKKNCGLASEYSRYGMQAAAPRGSSSGARSGPNELHLDKGLGQSEGCVFAHIFVRRIVIGLRL
jgi:hypothetical protein